MYDIMIVEDEQRIRSGIKKWIPWEEMGFRITADAESGLEALQKFDHIQPDVVLTDICMPGMDGMELMRQLRSRNRLTKFVVLSGHSEFEYARQSILYGASAYLLKPTKTLDFMKVFGQLREQLDAGQPKLNLEVAQLLQQLKQTNETGLIRAVLFINNQYDQRIGLSEAAEQAHMSPTYFSKYFKVKIGKTFIDYLTEIRIQQAKTLLRTTDYKVFEISLRIGYEDFRHFCKIFRAKEGVSPKQFRDDRQKEPIA